MDSRKHFTQMTPTEIQYLMGKIRGNSYTFKPHALDRMQQKRVQESQISAMLTYCTVIEAHNNIGSELRVLVRGKIQGNFCCAVISLTKKEIVTTYWNQAGDHHQTLDKSVYNWNADMSKV